MGLGPSVADGHHSRASDTAATDLLVAGTQTAPDCLSCHANHEPRGCIVAEVNPVPVAVRRTAKFMIAATQKLDPSRLALPNSQLDRGSVALVAVYRRKHLGRMRRLLAQLDQDVTVRLWCLDEPPDTLRHLTLGHGPGVRFKLLNDLINTIPAAKRRDGLVLSDDDYSFRVGTLPQLLTAGQALRLDMWQPAHDRSSFASFPFVRRQTATVLRRTTFVEQGPVLVLSARAQELLLPLPEDLGMAWGVEVRWAEVVKKYGLRLGIVDALAIHHFPPPEATTEACSVISYNCCYGTRDYPLLSTCSRSRSRSAARRTPLASG